MHLDVCQFVNVSLVVLVVVVLVCMGMFGLCKFVEFTNLSEKKNE